MVESNSGSRSAMRSYTAVRLIVRQGSGATTTEARLLHGEGQEVLAGTADEVTDAVTDLLGLRYEHFIKAGRSAPGCFRRLSHRPAKGPSGPARSIAGDGSLRAGHAARQSAGQARRGQGEDGR